MALTLAELCLVVRVDIQHVDVGSDATSVSVRECLSV